MSKVIDYEQSVKRCPKCELWKSFASFYIHKESGRINSYCKECAKVYQRELRAGGLHSSQKWAARHPGYQRKNYVSVRGRANSLIGTARRRSKKYNRDFDLCNHVDDIIKILEVGKCQITSIPFEFDGEKKYAHPYSPSIDRIDSSKGYTFDNVRIIVWILNLAFNNWGSKYFEEVEVAYLKSAEYQESGAKVAHRQ